MDRMSEPTQGRDRSSSEQGSSSEPTAAYSGGEAGEISAGATRGGMRPEHGSSITQGQFGFAEGSDVYGSDGDKVGKVTAILPNYVVVEKGFFFPIDFYIPISAIHHVEEDQIYLTVTKDGALMQGWDVPPGESGDATDTAEEYDETYYDETYATEGDRDTIRVPVYEEELTATTRTRERGEVRVEKDVVTEEQVFEVPVNEERIRVDRRAVDRSASAGDATVFRQDTIEVPIRGEEVELQKQTRVVEEVEITKEAVQRTEHVAGTVRREEVQVRGGGGGAGESPPAPPPEHPQEGAVPAPTEPRPRHLQGRLPERVRHGDRIPLLARVALRSEGASVELLRAWAVPEEGADVTLVLHSPGFVPRSPISCTVHVPLDEDSDWALFEIEAQETGVHTLEVSAHVEGAYLGTLPLQVTVDSQVATGPSIEREELIRYRMPEPGEITLEVRYDDKEMVYRYQFHGGPFGMTEPLEAGPMQRTPKAAVEDLIKYLNANARDQTGFTPANAKRLLVNKGLDLWNEFTPPEFKRLFWQHHDAIKRLTIISAGDPVPWELLYPDGPERLGFLAEQFVVARGRYGPFSPSRLRRSRPVFVVPDGSPATARSEVEVLQSTLGGASVGTLDELLARFDEADFGLLHFACHNKFLADSPTASHVQMGSQRFEIDFLTEHKGRFSSRSPLVFMNACRSGGVAPNYTESVGWATRFLTAGAGAFVGSLWEVRDTSASRYAAEFYGALSGGATLGDAMRTGREAIQDVPGDPTWLAYSLHGDPAAILYEEASDA